MDDGSIQYYDIVDSVFLDVSRAVYSTKFCLYSVYNEMKCQEYLTVSL